MHIRHKIHSNDYLVSTVGSTEITGTVNTVFANLLSEIVDCHYPITTQKLFRELDFCGYEDLDTKQKLYYIMVNQIRYGITKNIPLRRTPRRFKEE